MSEITGKLHDRARDQRKRQAVPGVLLGSGGLVALVYGFSEAGPRGWASPWVAAPLMAGVLLLAAFVWWQHRAAGPLLPLRIFRDRSRAGAFATMGLATIGMFGVFLFLTYYFQAVLGYPPVRTGPRREADVEHHHVVRQPVLSSRPTGRGSDGRHRVGPDSSKAESRSAMSSPRPANRRTRTSIGYRPDGP